jgi:hypothetical protein
MSRALTVQDFGLERSGTVDAVELLRNPRISLCTFDDTKRAAVFAELPEHTNPALQPFFHHAQYEHAVRLFMLDYKSFHALAAEVAPRPSKLVFIHNIGRCGSTLIHNLFNRIDGAGSLSEPDAISIIQSMRAGCATRDVELVDLLRSSVRVLFKSHPELALDVGVIKLRNQCLDILELIYQAFPQATHLFFYRSAHGWITSLQSRRMRFGRTEDFSLSSATSWFERYYNHSIDFTDLGLTALPDPLTSVQQLTISWLMMMDQYLRCRQQDRKIPAVRYEELNASRHAVVSALLSYVGLPLRGIREALAAFSQDSQVGTRMAREDAQMGAKLTFSAQELYDIAALLQQHPIIKSSEFRVPDHLS